MWVKAFDPFEASIKVVELARKMKKLANYDPRKIIHSNKVGLALTYFKTLYDSFGVNTIIWMVLTVVVVFDFSVSRLAHCLNLI